MRKIYEIIDTSPWKVLIGISFFYFLLIFIVKNPKPVYGDGGLMYLQTKQIVDSNFSTFRFDYKGRVYDSTGRYAPYTKPFLAKIENNYYIDFPPYFPLLNSLFYKFFDYRGLYILSFLSLILSLFFLSRIGKTLNFSHRKTNLLLFLFAFCTSVPLYNFVYHEYPLAIFLFIASAYFLIHSFQDNSPKKIYYILFGLFAGISLFFRLELMFVYLALGISFLFYKKNGNLSMIVFSGLGFILPFGILMSTNFYLHSHPLGLRYVLTLENTNETISMRLNIIQMMLFSPLRGIFFQSPFTLVAIFLFFTRKNLNVTEKFLFFAIVISFCLILFISPNDGDHIAPRYLFGIFPLLCVLFLLLIPEFDFKGFNTIFQILIILSILFSSYSLWKNIRWISNSDKNIISFNTKLNKIPEKIIIFQEYASTLNLQNSYSDRIFFVAEKKTDLENLIQSLIKNNTEKFVIAENAIQTTQKDTNPSQASSNNNLDKKSLDWRNDPRLKTISKTQDFPFIFHHIQVTKK
ncbi:MAG: hypothetical protein L6Q54_07860 [Leptospiraceae bacterium]|nr:hypothetical protein [Leptospiraceae bacterium]MCK6381149.1 hypothetical protein [Leptospiraceae bacterium]NUM42102.1 hypothetical protein [Leptospiraceae bacterium]